MGYRVVGTPSPASRPRVGKFGTYYAKGYQVFMADCQKQIAVTKPVAALVGELGAVVEIIVKRPKTSKLETPRGDVDNYAKPVLDAATKAGLWGDDGQVIALAVSKRFAEPGEEPGAKLLVGRLVA